MIVTYDLTNADDRPCTIGVEVSDDDGLTYDVQVSDSSFAGAIGSGVQPGTNKQIVFDPAETPLASVYSRQIRFRVTATDDGQGGGPAPEGFALIPAGTFMMGSPSGELGRHSDETQHEVTLTRAFYMGVTEVTNEEMAEVLNWALGQGLLNASSGTVRNAEGSAQELLDLDDSHCQISYSGGQFVVDSGKGDYPCIEVSWYGAMAYCHYLTRKEGGLTQAVDLGGWSVDFAASGYRPPTEAEWEYACRAGTTTAFYTGEITYTGSSPLDPNLDAAGWYWGNSTNPDNPISSGKGTHPFAQKQANAWGLYDTHGNVWEWCWDWYGSYGGDVTDPMGPTSGSGRVFRGGSWLNYAQSCRSAFRYWVYPSFTNPSYGFRAARSVNP